MTSTLQTVNRSSVSEVERFQRRVTLLVAELVVRDDNGQHGCSLTSRAEFDGKPLATIQALLFGFVTEWSKLYNSLMSEVQARRFGFVNEALAKSMEAVLHAGTSILCGLQALHRIDHADRDHELCNHILDMKVAVQALRSLLLSYEMNPADDVLDTLVIAN